MCPDYQAAFYRSFGMAHRSFAGAHTALVTPLLRNGFVDWAGYEKNIRFQIEQGITGLLPAGTTGESPTLSWEEHNRVIDDALQASQGRCVVIAGTGSNATDEALLGSKHAAEMGAHALLLVDCYYNGPSSLELRREYHAAVAKACPGCTVMPYIIPGRCGTAMSPEDLAILAHEYPNVSAVKEATGDLDRMAYTRKLIGPDFDILSGDDGITAEIMLREDIRADGVISVISNVAPGSIVRMVQAAQQGDAARVREIDAALQPLFNLVTVTVDNPRSLPDGRSVNVKDRFRNPLPIKTLMNGLGLPAGPPRRPIGKMTRNAVEVVRDAARTVLKANPWVLEPLNEAYGISVAERIERDDCWAGLAYA
jgi:4-hydroxy-tetrahydrodipicolinate synthase